MEYLAKLKSFVRVKATGPKARAHVKFIFSNSRQLPIEAFYDADTTMSEVKEDLLLRHWPETLGPVENVFRLRLFYCGIELKDWKCLRDYRIGISGELPSACHIFIVYRQPKNSESSSNRCICTIS